MPTFLDQDLNVDTVNTTGDVDIEGNVNVVGTPVDGSQVVIRDTTTSSANAGGSLRLSSNDGSPMGDSHRLGVIEFTGAEDSSNTQIVGARIEALTDAAWTNVENGCALYFYTTDGNNSQTNVLKIDSNKKSTFNGVIDVTDTTDSSDATGDTGALRVEGGASIAKKLFVGENLTVTGDLTVNGTTTTVSTTNTVVSDKLLELANGTSGTPSGDAGIIIERGSSNNAAIIWDESTDTFVVGTTTATGASTGDLSVTDAAFQAAAITASGDISTTGEVKTAKVSYTDGDDAITIADGGGITANTSLTLASGATVTAINDEDNMTSNSATALATQQSIKAYVDSQTSGSGNMDNWILEDDDGTEVTVSNGKEVKFIGSGITTNFTDVSDGSDADPFDLTFTVDAAQTGITSILATDLKIGEDDQTKIDFETADQINFYANNAKRVTIDSSGLTIDSGSLETATIDYTDGDLAITIADGGGITAAAGITSTAAANTLGATSFNDANITNVGDIALDSISADGTDINVAVSDNSATALTIKQGSDAYLIVDTADGSESVSVGTGISGTAITLGHSTSETTVADNLTVTGDTTSSNGFIGFANGQNATLKVAATGSGTDGRDLTIEAGSAPAGATNQNGGDLLLKSGDGDGNGTSIMTFATKTAAADTAAERMRIGTNGNVVVNGSTAHAASLTIDGASASIALKEMANAPADTAAFGQLWVKNTTPAELYFTTDAGNDIQLTSGTSAAGGGSVTANDASLILATRIFS